MLPTAFLRGGTLYYNGSSAGSVNVTDAVTDSGSGPASATFPVIATTGWTHAAETVTSGSGSAPTINYISSTFKWSANPEQPDPTGYTVSSKRTSPATPATARR